MASPDIRKYKWLVLILLGGAYFFHQVDRAIFGVLTPVIAADLNLSKIDIGHINTVLFVTIALFTFLAGFLGDRCNRKWIITSSLLFWSFATVAIGFVDNFTLLGVTVSTYALTMFLRSIAVGGGESFYAPSAMSLLASCHTSTRSLAFSIHQAALYIGLMLSGVLAAKVFYAFGTWRAVFVVFGLLGALLGIVFIFILKEVPRSGEAMKTGKIPIKDSFKAYFGNPSAMLATTGFVAIVCVNNAYICWAPTIFAERFGVEAGIAGKHTMFYHHLVAFGAILAGGWLTDRFVRTMPRFRLSLQIFALSAGALSLYFIGRSGSFASAVALTAVYGLFRGLFEVNTHASVFDVISSRHQASVVGFMLLIAMITGAFFAGELIGAVLERFGDAGCRVAFGLMAATYFAAAVMMTFSFLFTFKKDRRKKEEDERS